MICVILLNWNGWVDTIACLKSLSRLEGAAPGIVVCDNASIDDSWVRLQGYVDEHPEQRIRLVQTGANLGFAGGNNVGLKIALSDPETEFIWLLNNDTEAAPESLSALVTYMAKHADVGICGSTLLYMDEPSQIQAVGGQYNAWLGTSKHILGHQKYSPLVCESIDPDSLDYVVGASMFVRRSVLEQVGLLSEEYFLYCEEIDLATRMKRQMPELKLGYAPASLVYHKEGASTGANDHQEKTYSYFADYFFITSRIRFARKFFPIQRWTVQLAMLPVVINRLRRKQWRSILVAICALFGWIPESLDPRKRLKTRKT